MSTVTKNQHYVPQFLLRNFATRHGRTHRIHVFDTIRNDLRCNQNVADVCAQNYFYDNDNWVENFLETNVETPAVAEIAALCSEGRQVPHFPSRAMARFITVQWARTAEATSQTLAAANGLIGTMSQELLRLNGFDEAAAPRIRLVLTDPKQHHARLALSGCNAWILIQDLRQHLIINDTTHDFLISDHPVAQSNLYLGAQPVPHAASMSAAGAQLFLPLSTRHLLCLYDASVYKYGSRHSNVSRIDSKETVRAINLLQARNTPGSLMFRDQVDREAVRQMSETWQNRPLWTQQNSHSRAMPIRNGQLRSVHMVARMQAPPHVLLPFFKIKNSTRRRPAILEDRDPVAVAVFERLMTDARYVKSND
ncbi:MAG: DUF4238 domain-containing protein [Lysobacteraceae bacterium]